MNRFFVYFLFSLGFTTAAIAQTAAPPTPDAVSAVFACASVQSEEERLSCYDSAVANMQRAQTQGDLVAVDRAQVRTIQRESFGFSLPSISGLLPNLARQEADTVEQLEMQVTRITDRANGRHAFVMNNGQVWTQVEAQRVYNIREGDTITVRRAALGSYLLSPARGGAAHRVRRED
jgi:hypothetical protein